MGTPQPVTGADRLVVRQSPDNRRYGRRDAAVRTNLVERLELTLPSGQPLLGHGRRARPTPCSSIP
jgi:hypothetical protein